ncbi:hypothetical protein Tco_1557884, partial [Tanacetum coccineum]
MEVHEECLHRRIARSASIVGSRGVSPLEGHEEYLHRRVTRSVSIGVHKECLHRSPYHRGLLRPNIKFILLNFTKICLNTRPKGSIRGDLLARSEVTHPESSIRDSSIGSVVSEALKLVVARLEVARPKLVVVAHPEVARPELVVTRPEVAQPELVIARPKVARPKLVVARPEVARSKLVVARRE